MSDAKRHRRTSGVMKRWMRNNLLIILIIVVVGVVAFSLSMRSYCYNSVSTGLKTKAKTTSEIFSGFIANTYKEYYESASTYVSSFVDASSLELQFIDTEGRVEISSYGITAGTSPGTEDITQALETGKIFVWKGVNADTSERIMAVSSPMLYSDGEIIGVLRYVTSLVLVERQVLFYTLGAAGVGAAIILIILMTNMYFIRSVVTPLRDVTRMVGRIAEGSYGTRITRKYKDEVGELVDSINEMSARIGTAEKLQTEFISSVSHELRTPLTAISGWSETLMYDENMDQDSRKGVEIILKESGRLTKMVEELLDFTRMQDGRFTLNVKKMDVIAELKEAVVVYGELLKQDGIRLRYTPYKGVGPKIDGDPERLRQVFLNLLDNAAKYGRDGKRIDVSSEVGERWVLIRIRDHGPGVPPEELDNIKRKFYKVNPKSRGSGIGLAVCDEIIRYHNGELILNNAIDGGLEVTVMLPVPEET